MTQITREDVQYLAQLSKLQLEDQEIDSLASDITNILRYVEMLGELKTEGIEPSYQVTGLENGGRDDIADATFDLSKLLSCAPDTADNQVKVPKVL